MTLKDKKEYVTYVMDQMEKFQIESFEFEGMSIKRESQKIFQVYYEDKWKSINKTGDKPNALVGKTRKFRNPLLDEA